MGGTDQAAQVGWWSDYAERATVFALAGVLAASRGPGWRVLRVLCSAGWLYLGLVAALVLHTIPGRGVVSAAPRQFWWALDSASLCGWNANVKCSPLRD